MITSLGTSGGRLLASGITNNSISSFPSTTNNNVSVTGSSSISDTRVRLSLPPGSELYYKDSTNSLLKILQTTNGVVFPFQPPVSQTYTAAYQALSVVHSNFQYNFYQSSMMQPLNISGDFVVRNPFEGSYVLAAITFLRSCTMMFTGNDGNYAGAPPPVLRLTGMGFGGLDNIPVVLTSIMVDYPEGVDYVTVPVVGLLTGNETSKVPVQLRITVMCQPMFSRQYAAEFSTKSYASGTQRLLGPYYGDTPLVTATDSVTVTTSGSTTPLAVTPVQNSSNIPLIPTPTLGL